MSPERNTKESEEINRSTEVVLDVAILYISSVACIILKLCFISSRDKEVLVLNAYMQVSRWKKVPELPLHSPFLGTVKLRHLILK